MHKLIKYMKNSVWSIIFIVGFLALQAVCDLALPDYTSKIVNVGIQQGGISNYVPSAIRKSTMDKLLLFVSTPAKKDISENYTLVDYSVLTPQNKELYKQKYPKIEEAPIYELGKCSKETETLLDGAFEGAITIVSELSSTTSVIGNQITNGGTLDFFETFAQTDKNQQEALISLILKEFEELPDTVTTQSSVQFIRSEYEAIGINTDQQQLNYIFWAGGSMLLVALLSLASAIAVAFLGSRVAASLGMELRGRVFGKVVSFSNAEFDKFSTASLITRSTNDIQQIQLLMVMLLRIVFYAPIIGIGGIVKVMSRNSSMTWILAVAVFAVIALVIVLFVVAMPKFKLGQKLIDKLNLVSREILTGLPVIRAFSTQKYEEARFDKANRELTKNHLFVNRAMSFMMPVMMLIMNLVSVMIVWSGSHGVDAGTMQIGDMMAFIQYAMQIIISFLMISMVSIMLPRASVSAIRIEEVIQTPITIYDPKQPKSPSSDLKGIVEFRNVSFRYPNAHEYVLKNISFKTVPGQTTAIVGSCGSGKSTLINLIPRFYDITDGEILMDGIDIREMSQTELRSKIGLVPQKGVLFSGTIESNIKYADRNLSDEVMETAADISQSLDFINEKNEKFQSEISQGGTNVSGGQKQRLSIARAIAKNPEVYIFDDSFSALDNKTDIALRKALAGITANSAVIIVAQKISTILHADQIIVLDEGSMVGIGSHKELLQNCEVYKEIAASQLSKEELANE